MLKSLFKECGVFLGPGKNHEEIIQSWKLGDDTTELVDALIRNSEPPFRKPYGNPTLDIYDEFESDILALIEGNIGILNIETDRFMTTR